MQNAYISETGTGIGNWKMIGYKMNSTSNFKYYEGSTENGETAGGSWQLDVAANQTSGGSALYNGTISSNNCAVLTPSFQKIQTGTYSEGS